jgi:glycerophosphoryl diester phosphodiesterase
VLVARHEPFIGTTRTDDRDSTNVATQHRFDDRITTRVLDGDSIEGWWVADFTLAELKTLGAQQTRGGRPTQFDGQFKIPTLQEIINLVKREAKKRGRRIGIYPETKHPTFHDDLGLSLEEPLVKTLKKNGLNSKNSPVFIQSFEQSNLQELNHMTRVRLIQLIDAYDTDASGNPIFTAPNDRPYDWTKSGRTGPNDNFGYLTTDAGLDEVKAYADGIGPWKIYIIPSNPDGVLFPHTDLIKRAHDRGLKVHTWTFRDDSFPSGYAGGPVDEYLAFYKLGIDGVFSDFPDTAFGAREIFRGL